MRIQSSLGYLNFEACTVLIFLFITSTNVATSRPPLPSSKTYMIRSRTCAGHVGRWTVIYQGWMGVDWDMIDSRLQIGNQTIGNQTCHRHYSSSPGWQGCLVIQLRHYQQGQGQTTIHSIIPTPPHECHHALPQQPLPPSPLLREGLSPSPRDGWCWPHPLKIWSLPG